MATLIKATAKNGAELIVTPEGVNLLERDRSAFSIEAPLADPAEAMAPWQGLARQVGVPIILGSLLLRQPTGKAVNRSVVLAADGSVQATYDKIHLFDVNLGEASGLGDETRESAAFEAGSSGTITTINQVKIGLTICYDLRFPELYRSLARSGAQIITVPAAFTALTGEAHWETLLRARAIETGSFILAPAQGGRHEDGRNTWGRTMAVDPWGKVLGCLDHDEPGSLIVEVDISKVAKARVQIPAWSIDKPYPISAQ